MKKTGSCKICGINLYEPEHKPDKKTMPCLIQNCPYETKEDQEKAVQSFDKLYTAVRNGVTNYD